MFWERIWTLLLDKKLYNAIVMQAIWGHICGSTLELNCTHATDTTFQLPRTAQYVTLSVSDIFYFSDFREHCRAVVDPGDLSDKDKDKDKDRDRGRGRGGGRGRGTLHIWSYLETMVDICKSQSISLLFCWDFWTSKTSRYQARHSWPGCNDDTSRNPHICKCKSKSSYLIRKAILHIFSSNIASSWSVLSCCSLRRFFKVSDQLPMQW